MIIESNRDYVAATGSTEEIIELMFGPRQHDEHCKGWRWHVYIGDSKKRADSVDAAVRELIAARRAREEIQQAAE